MKIFLILILVTINTISKADYWTQKANYPGDGIVHSVCFSIGTKGYVGCGFDSTLVNWTHSDFWEFDPSTNVWTQKANVGGFSRGMAVSFSIGNLGYVGIGFSQGHGALSDFWEYNPINNIWTQKANFGGGNRDAAIGFSIGNMGYVGMGADNSGTRYNDLWQYNPVTDSWIQKTSCPGPVRMRANTFVIGFDAYIICGAWYLNDVWKYNSITDSWSQKGNFPKPYSSWAATFSLSGFGYYGTGASGGVTNDFWLYNPANDTWVQKTNFIGAPRAEASFFCIGLKGYLGLGHPNDFYEYTPDSILTTGIEDIKKLTLKVFPNPFTNKLNVGLDVNEELEITIYDLQSRKLLQQNFTKFISLNTEQLTKGVYIYEVRSRNGLCKKSKIIKD